MHITTFCNSKCLHLAGVCFRRYRVRILVPSTTNHNKSYNIFVVLLSKCNDLEYTMICYRNFICATAEKNTRSACSGFHCRNICSAAVYPISKSKYVKSLLWMYKKYLHVCSWVVNRHSLLHSNHVASGIQSRIACNVFKVPGWSSEITSGASIARISCRWWWSEVAAQ